jgi:hypothetical protein
MKTSSRVSLTGPHGERGWGLLPHPRHRLPVEGEFFSVYIPVEKMLPRWKHLGLWLVLVINDNVMLYVTNVCFAETNGKLGPLQVNVLQRWKQSQR